MEQQSASAVLLVRPAAFGFHAEAAASNLFARPSADADLQSRALAEFDALERALTDAGVRVLVLDDTAEPPKPDAVFPNNWVSFHADGTMVLYPMATRARRLERRAADVRDLMERSGFTVRRVVDLSRHEESGAVLEGTGSLVLDRPARRAYASRSPRTDARVIAEFDRELAYSTVLFDAVDQAGEAIYHTNVLLSLAAEFAVVCVEAIAPSGRPRVLEAIEGSGRTIIETSFAQLGCFGCNVLALRSSRGEPLIAMSEAARKAFSPHHLRALEKYGTLVSVAIPTIEAVGGGGVRCMIAEVHLPPSA